jgi:hypothetical protein
VVNRHIRKGIQKEKAGNCDGYGRCIVNINGPYEIALLAFKLQAAVKTIIVHRKRASIQRAYVTAGASEANPRAEHR